MIPAWVESYIGLPWKDRGRTREGCDCFGLLRLVYAEVFNIQLPSYELRYPSTTDKVAVARLFFEETTSTRWRQVFLRDATPPDALLMAVAGAQHVGILVATERFLHILPGRQTCVERFRPMWTNRVEAVYRHEALVLV